MHFKALREIYVLDGYELRIESADGFEIALPKPEEAVAYPGEDQVGQNCAAAGDDPDRPALGEHHGSAADSPTGFKAPHDLCETARMHPAVGIAGYHDFPLGGGDSRIANGGEIFRIFAHYHAAVISGDLLRVVGAAVQNDDHFDRQGKVVRCSLGRAQARTQVGRLVVGRDDDGDFGRFYWKIGCIRVDQFARESNSGTAHRLRSERDFSQL